MAKRPGKADDPVPKAEPAQETPSEAADAAENAPAPGGSGDESAGSSADGQAPGRDEAADTGAAAEPAETAPSSEEPEPAGDATAPPAATPRRAGGAILPATLVAGAIAAAVGIAAARLFAPDPVELSAPLETATAANREALAAQQTRLEALEARISAHDPAALAARIDEAQAERATLAQAVARVEGRLEAIEGRIDDIEARLTQLEKRPVAEAIPPEAMAAYEREVEALRAALRSQREEIEALLAEKRAELDAIAEKARAYQENAEREERLAAARAALARIAAALADGQPFAEAVTELQSTGLTEVPPALRDAAETGVPTAARLRADFPEAARRALAAARAAEPLPGDAPLSERLRAFVLRQLNVRSTVPRPGDDPDAVLARAEAALAEDRLADALAELAALPGPARAEMAAWMEEAERRRAALDALTAVARALEAS